MTAYYYIDIVGFTFSVEALECRRREKYDSLLTLTLTSFADV